LTGKNTHQYSQHGQYDEENDCNLGFHVSPEFINEKDD
jgi:hypothetical protein